METVVEVSRDMRVDAVVAELVPEHGEAKARNRALREQQGARRARSRKRYTF